MNRECAWEGMRLRKNIGTILTRYHGFIVNVNRDPLVVVIIVIVIIVIVIIIIIVIIVIIIIIIIIAATALAASCWRAPHEPLAEGRWGWISQRVGTG